MTSPPRLLFLSLDIALLPSLQHRYWLTENHYVDYLYRNSFKDFSIDTSKVLPLGDAKPISRETTFGQDTRDCAFMDAILWGKKYRRVEHSLEDYPIGCILLQEPFFLPEQKWIPVPTDWKMSIQQGRRYDLTVEPGLSLWQELRGVMTHTSEIHEERARYGEPVLTSQRLGQGSFRILVTDACDRRCAVTNERTLPALDAAHIKPYSESGQHVVSNGILLRRDLHALFDRGYVTITPSMELDVSRRIKEEYENGRDYYRLHGSTIRVPVNLADRPSREYLDWHNSKIYRG